MQNTFRHCGLDPQSPMFGEIRGSRVKPGMTYEVFCSSLISFGGSMWESNPPAIIVTAARF